MALVPYNHDGDTEDIEAKPSIVGSRFYVDNRIGRGSFGVIYRGVECRGNYRVAIKFENRKTIVPQLRDEYRTYRILNDYSKSSSQLLQQESPTDGRKRYGGVPTAYYFGNDSIYNCLVLDLLGPSLEDLFDRCGRKFSVPTVCQLGLQMIYLVEMIHSCGLIYRDIKPDNFLIGLDNLIYVVDFGMAKQFRDPRTHQHIPYKEKKSLSGTARYMSINTHLGREQSRRDDLEALGHVLFYFLRGSLPWQGLKAATNKEKYEKIGLKKQEIVIKELAEGLPEEFANYLAYTRSLKFDATPDYAMLRGYMQRAFNRTKNEGSAGTAFKFDWEEQRTSWEADLSARISESELQRLKAAALNNPLNSVNVALYDNNGKTNGGGNGNGRNGDQILMPPRPIGNAHRPTSPHNYHQHPLNHALMGRHTDLPMHPTSGSAGAGGAKSPSYYYPPNRSSMMPSAAPFSAGTGGVTVERDQIPQRKHWIRRLFCF